MADDATQQKSGRLYVISAPSGGGKTSLTRALIRRLEAQGRSLCFSISYTTRAQRAGEVDGVDYHFVERACFEAMIARAEFLEYARVFDHYYGTSKTQTDRLLAAGHDVVLDIDWQGAAQVRRRARAVVSIFIRPPSRAELERRLRARGSEDEAAVTRRLAEADAELAHASDYDHQIVNDCFDRALDELAAIFERSG